MCGGIGAGGRQGRLQARTAPAATSPFTIVPAMASIGSSRLCAHAEKLCQYGHFTQLRRKVSTTTCAKSRPVVSRTSAALFQHCQVRLISLPSVNLAHENTIRIVPRSAPRAGLLGDRRSVERDAIEKTRRSIQLSCNFPISFRDFADITYTPRVTNVSLYRTIESRDR